MKNDAPRIERYLQKLFDNRKLKVISHPKKSDMAELMIGDEFIGAIYRDEEDGEVSYPLQISILEIDLEDSK